MSQIIKVKTSDGETLDVPKNVAMESAHIKRAMEFASGSDEIKFDDIDSNTMKKVVEYCEYHNRVNQQEGIQERDIKQFDNAFVNMPNNLLFSVVTAAHYLEIKALLDLCCAKIASTLKGKSPEEIRAQYNIENDLTPDDIADIKTEASWLYQ
ncbi:putative E3 ubiquitin ligase complex SCF subunit sconC [Blattamonas nauphoetae]|uniref:E3 ubiquitin ligase complex SCF subunit sconC n=1 Tax=Blattamonas nauphoetae TaxID=2049346 RepID=A0ABQ9XBM5_9EUKA|nr:putative E3 ubiquitin ligase complex SCF subunit sconC [Blattamonas nauphoetae]